MSHWSLALRLTIWYAATAFLLLAGVAWVQYRSLSADLAGEDDQLVLETLAAARRAGGVSISAADPASALLGPLVRVLDPMCHVVGGIGVPDGPPPVCDPAADSGPTLHTWVSPSDRTWRIASQRASGSASPAVPHPDTTVAWFEVVLDRWTDIEVLRGYRRKLGIVLPAALLLFGALGLWLARRGLAPIQILARAVARIDSRSLGRRLDVAQTPPEVRTLVRSFEDMRERLDTAFAALTQFSTELAHEFHTPLHVLRQQTEIALARARTPDEYREVLGSTLEEVNRLHHMVDDILFLARAEDPRSRIDATALTVAVELADVVDFLEPLSSGQGVGLGVEVPEGLPTFSADRMLLRRALVNLVANAIRHTPPGGCVILTAERRDESMAIAVRDTGAGIPASALPYVFDRYFRVPGTSRSGAGGTGLGLAIVRGIMSLHGGIATVTSPPAGGTEVTLLFPSGQLAATAEG